MNITWTLWLLVLASSFATFESYALAKNKTTLSRYVWNISKTWSMLGCAVGLISGIVLSHFFWPCQGCPL